MPNSVKRKLNVIQTTVEEIRSKWDCPLPTVWKNPLFIRSNSKGEVNWEKAPIYQEKELIDRGNYTIIQITTEKDLALTTLQLLVNATGAEFEDEELAVQILEELIINVKK